MFGFLKAPPILLHLSRQEFSVWKVVKGKQVRVGSLKPSAETIGPFLKKLKSVVKGNPLHVVFDDELMYQFELTVSSSILKNKSEIQTELEKHVPESLFGADWDILSQTKEAEGMTTIRVAVPMPDFWHGIRKMIKEEGMSIAQRLPASEADECIQENQNAQPKTPTSHKPTHSSKSFKKTKETPPSRQPAKSSQPVESSASLASPESLDPISALIQSEKQEHPEFELMQSKNHDETSTQQSTHPAILILITLTIAAAMAFGGMYLADTNPELLSPTPIESPTTITVQESSPPTPNPTPAQTPEPQSLSTLSVQILNGSGRAGAARKLATKLTNAGVENIKTGNASRYDFSNTVIQFAASITTETRDLLLEKLEDPDATIGSDLTTSSFDVVITIGQSQE